MRAYVIGHLSNDGNARYLLSMGDMIGRMEQAALFIDDPRISEAHAMVSLRGESLVLLALRGRFRVDGQVKSKVVLKEGLEIELHNELAFICDEVVLPARLLGLKMDGLPQVSLTQTTSIVIDAGKPRLHAGYNPAAHALLWSSGGRWSIRLGKDDPGSVIRVGDVFKVDGKNLEIVEVDLREAARSSTRQTLTDPLLLDVTPRSVSISTSRCHLTTITGVPGRILSALATHGAPMFWEDLVSVVWSEDRSLASSLRRRLDVGVLRLRERLVQSNLSSELIKLDGAGMIEFDLRQVDAVNVK